jgi:hypothetical protein
MKQLQDKPAVWFRFLAWGILSLFGVGVLIMAGVGLSMLTSDYLAISRAQPAAASVTSTEIVTHTRIHKGRKRHSYSVLARYSYSIDGRSYSGSQVFHRSMRGSQREAETARRLAAAATTAYVDPADPNKAFLLPWRDASPASGVAAAGLMFGVGVFIGGGLVTMRSRGATRHSSGGYRLAMHRSPNTRRNTLAAIALPLLLASLAPMSFYFTEPAERVLPTEVHVFALLLGGLAVLSLLALAYFTMSARVLPAASVELSSESAVVGGNTAVKVMVRPGLHVMAEAKLRVRCIRSVTKRRGKGSASHTETLAEFMLPLGTITPGFHQREAVFETTLSLPAELPPTGSKDNTDIAYVARLMLVRTGAVDAVMDFHLPAATS